jgi:NADH:ubiquinone oxidoreductase subunit 3 (subunit A)
MMPTSLVSKNFLNQQLKNNNIMGNLLYIIAVVLLIAWAIGFVGYGTGGLIHALLVIAIIAVILRLIQGKKI